MASETFPPPAATSAVQHTDAATTVVRTSTGHEARTEAKTCDVQHIATVGGGGTQPDNSSALDSSGNHLAMLSSQPMSGDNRDKTMEASAEQSLTRTSTIQSSSTASTLKASSIMSSPAKVDDNNSESLKAPKVGMVFKSEEDAYEFYNEYAGKIGFSIRKSHSKLRPDKTIYKKHIVCSNEGERHTHSTHETLKQNAETRSRCDARVQFSIARDGVWKVQKVVLEHNHYLWAAVYRNDSFSADMTTTQRSDGMNNVFKKQIRKRLCLSELLVEYEKCAVSLRENELDADFKSRKSTPVPYVRNLPMLKTAAESYTRRLYTDFEEQFKQQFFVKCELISEVENVRTYKVMAMQYEDEAIVTFNYEDVTISCSCRMFESKGAGKKVKEATIAGEGPQQFTGHFDASTRTNTTVPYFTNNMFVGEFPQQFTEAAQATDVDKATPTVGIPTACPVTAASLRRICDGRRDERLRWAQLEAVARAVLPNLMADDVPLAAWAAFGSRLSSPAQGEVGRRG
ncbi:hypothetical protein ACQ4PT_044794 [Festuca glaucescens]